MSDEFEGIESGDNNPSSCTPEIESDFVGIKINTPESVIWTAADRDDVTEAFARAMVCGIYRLPSIDIVDTDGFNLTASVIATDIQTHQSYAAKMVPDMPLLEDPEPHRPTDEELAGQYETGYFNVNMLDYLELPEKAADYNVFVVFGSSKSNVNRLSLAPASD